MKGRGYRPNLTLSSTLSPQRLVVIAICHCERPLGAKQSPFFSTHYEIASVASLLRNDIATQPLKGEGKKRGGKHIILVEALSMAAKK